MAKEPNAGQAASKTSTEEKSGDPIPVAKAANPEKHRNVKNLIVCCDGTGNQIGGDYSNVLKFFRTLKKDERQLVHYDPGVGTLATASWPWLSKLKLLLGLALGVGLQKNITDAYRFICDHYEKGDRIYLLGFSRGAYTVRALAGLIYSIGILRPHEDNLIEYGLRDFRISQETGDKDKTWRFHQAMSHEYPAIEFVGVWDSVASSYYFGWNPLRWIMPYVVPNAEDNPAIRIFREACSLDEKRRKFRLMGWKPDQPFKPNPFADHKGKMQDAKRVWYAGVHSDVGGGYQEKESAISKFPLEWMIGEAQKAGSRFKARTINYMVLGKKDKSIQDEYVAPDALADIHDSMKLSFFWRLLEYVPKLAKYREWPDRKVWFGFYLPMAEPRPVPEGALLHRSLVDRLEGRSDYKPVNVPKSYEIEERPDFTEKEMEIDDEEGDVVF